MVSISSSYTIYGQVAWKWHQSLGVKGFSINSRYLIEKNLAKASLLSGVVVALLNFVRPMGILIIASVCCFYLCKMLAEKIYFRLVSHLGMFLMGYFVVAFLLDTMLLNLNYTDERVSMSSRNKYHKISYTLYDSKVDGHIADYQFDYERYNEDYREELISQVVNHPAQITMSVANKMVRYLGLFDYLFEMTYNHDEKVWMRYPVKAIYILLSGFSICSICYWPSMAI